MLSNVAIEKKEIVLLGDFNCDFTVGDSSKQINDFKFVTCSSFSTLFRYQLG